MAGKVRVQPVSRVGLEPLIEMAEQLRGTLHGWEDTDPPAGRAKTASDLAHDLAHLAAHDLDSFLIASIDDSVVGFAASFVRSRQLTIGPLWFLPEYLDHRAAETLVRRALAFGERSGANDAVALVLGGAPHHALLFRFGLRPRLPVYRLRLDADTAGRVGQELAKLLPGTEMTQEGLERRAGIADMSRLDRLCRGITRELDHEYWLAQRRLRLAVVRDGTRIAGYAYGGPAQCGPVAASTPEAALAALGWALQLAAPAGDAPVDVLLPARFESGIEHLLEAGATCLSVATWMSRNPSSGLERTVLAAPALF